MALGYFADLDVRDRRAAAGPAPVATRLVAEPRRAEVIRRVRDACMTGSQACWVCPLIETA
jgi:ATP-dependent DNA helicase RecG